jgi:hypothetical protein
VKPLQGQNDRLKLSASFERKKISDLDLVKLLAFGLCLDVSGGDVCQTIGLLPTLQLVSL